MKTIWKRLLAAEITAKDAYIEINDRLYTASEGEKKRLIELSNRIMDRELPLENRNNDVELTYQALTGER